MLYLLDANVLIDADRDYYPIPRVPEFWEWLVHKGTEGSVKVPRELYDGIKKGHDDLAKWAKDAQVDEALTLSEEPNSAVVTRVINDGYAPDLTEDELEIVDDDALLIAYALSVPGERCVVTTEVPKPKRQRANRHVPDVCKDLGVPVCNTFQFVRELDFRTGWKAR